MAGAWRPRDAFVWIGGASRRRPRFSPSQRALHDERQGACHRSCQLRQPCSCAATWFASGEPRPEAMSKPGDAVQQFTPMKTVLLPCVMSKKDGGAYWALEYICGGTNTGVDMPYRQT